MRAFRERHPVVVGLLATLVAVAAVVAVLAAVTPHRSATSVPSEQDRLTQGQSLVDRALGPPGGPEWRPPEKVFTDARGDVHVQDGTDEAEYTPGLPAGVRLQFYRARGHESAYCLATRSRHLVVQNEPTSTQVLGGRGACPRPSAHPVQMND